MRAKEYSDSCIASFSKDTLQLAGERIKLEMEEELLSVRKQLLYDAITIIAQYYPEANTLLDDFDRLSSIITDNNKKIDLFTLQALIPLLCEKIQKDPSPVLHTISDDYICAQKIDIATKLAMLSFTHQGHFKWSHDVEGHKDFLEALNPPRTSSNASMNCWEAQLLLLCKTEAIATKNISGLYQEGDKKTLALRLSAAITGGKGIAPLPSIKDVPQSNLYKILAGKPNLILVDRLQDRNTSISLSPNGMGHVGMFLPFRYSAIRNNFFNPKSLTPEKNKGVATNLWSGFTGGVFGFTDVEQFSTMGKETGTNSVKVIKLDIALTNLNSRNKEAPQLTASSLERRQSDRKTSVDIPLTRKDSWKETIQQQKPPATRTSKNSCSCVLL